MNRTTRSSRLKAAGTGNSTSSSSLGNASITKEMSSSVSNRGKSVSKGAGVPGATASRAARSTRATAAGSVNRNPSSNNGTSSALTSGSWESRFRALNKEFEKQQGELEFLKKRVVEVESANAKYVAALQKHNINTVTLKEFPPSVLEHTGIVITDEMRVEWAKDAERVRAKIAERKASAAKKIDAINEMTENLNKISI